MRAAEFHELFTNIQNEQEKNTEQTTDETCTTMFCEAMSDEQKKSLNRVSHKPQKNKQQENKTSCNIVLIFGKTGAQSKVEITEKKEKCL